MIVLSMKRCFARFTSSAWRCSHNCFQRPRASQRLKRLYTASQWPKSCGKSRHGMPVRAIYNTASINMRSLCSGGLPALCLISAKMVAISAHAASVSTSLTLVISFPHDPITHHRGKDTYSRGNSSTRPSWQGVSLRGVGLVIPLIIALGPSEGVRPIEVGLSVGMVFGLIYKLCTASVAGLSSGEIPTKNRPNEGIYQSGRIAVISGLGVGLIFGLLGG